MRTLNEALFSSETVATSANSAEQPMDHIYCADLLAVVTGANPANKTFEVADVTAAADTVTITAHGYLTGTKVTLTTTTTLPAGLATSTDYFLIAVDADTLSFATNQANALAGTAIDITDAGTGTHTVAVTTTLAGTVKLQKNVQAVDSDPVWFDVPDSSQNITAAGNFAWALTDIGYRSLRMVVTITSGTVSVTARINGKGA